MSGYKIVLSADRSLMSEFRGEALFGFLTCAPKEYVPEILYDKFPQMKGIGALFGWIRVGKVP